VYVPIDGKAFKGIGTAVQVANRFLKQSYGNVHWEGINEVEESVTRTWFVFNEARTIVNKVVSPDIPLNWSINPYQGYEHGCAATLVTLRNRRTLLATM